MADFYIVPPRLTVGTFDRANVVNSINSLKGDLTFIADANSGIRVVISGNTFRFAITENYYVKKQGDIYPKNLVFTPEAGYYGLSVGSGAADPGTGATGGLFFNTTSNLLKVYSGSSWGEITGAGITQGAADLRYLKLDGTNTPTANISMGSALLRLANLTTQALPGTTGQMFFNTSTGRINVYNGIYWDDVGLGVTSIQIGFGLTSTQNPIVQSGTVSVDLTANYTWTGTHNFTSPVTFSAAGQSFNISKLFISGQSAGDLIYFNGTNWTKLGIGSTSQALVVDSSGIAVTWGAAVSTSAGLGLSTLNGIGSTEQYFAVGTSGTLFNISSIGFTHTFNIPIAGTGSTGLVSTDSQTFTGAKTFDTTLTVSAFTGSASTTTGALIVNGGVGIGGSLYTSSSYANSISGVVLSNGVITSGSWAGSIITGKYGGTGYSTYTKGDLLVGAGGTFVKFPVGSDSYVLVSSSSTDAGVAWTTPSSIGSTTIGTPADGLYTDGFFTSWTNSTTIANALDDINELLSQIAPARPGYLTATSLTATTVPTYYTVGISAGLGTEWYQAGYGTGSSITRYYLSGSHTLTTANTTTAFSAGSLTTSTYGTIFFNRYNYLTPGGGGVGTIDLSVNYAVNYTNNNLKLTALGAYNTIWTKANAQINTYTQPNSGYEGVYISHTENSQFTNTYDMWKDAWSASNTTPSFSQSATASTFSQTLRFLSGIGYYTTGTGFSVYFKGAAGIFSSCYNTTQVYAISATGLVTSTGTTSSPHYAGELDKSGNNHVRVTLNSASASSFNKYITATIYKAHSTTAASNATIGRAINTYSTTSTDTFEGFQDEARRLVIGTGIAFTSNIDMATGNLQVRSGTLSYPLAADYDTEYGGTHTFTGDQEYQRYFYKTSASTGQLSLGGFTASNVSSYGTGSVNLLLYLESDNKYFDLGVLQGSNANDGSSRAQAISAKIATSGSGVSWSFGVYSTGVSGAGNSGRYRAIVIYKNNTYSMTSITSS
jgi:hypothetical protein